jgi:hypothetical protein
VTDFVKLRHVVTLFKKLRHAVTDCVKLRHAVTQIHVLLLPRTRCWTFGFYKTWSVSCLAFQKVRCWLDLVSLLPANLLAVVAFFVRSSKNSSQETPISQRSVRTRTQVKGAGILITTVTCSQNRAHYLYCCVAGGWGCGDRVLLLF